MKHFGSNFYYEKLRNEELMKAYRKAMHQTAHIRLNEICRTIADMPASRFWVSEERAAVVVAKMMKGESIDYMRPLKRSMFLEIYRRVTEMMRDNPGMPICKCCLKVVNSPAPKFYMTPLSIRQTIFKIKSGWYNERLKRTSH